MTSNTGYVPTPPCVADYMTDWLFKHNSPTHSNTSILYPGLGTGNLHAATKRHCKPNTHPLPTGTAIEINSSLVDTFTTTHPNHTLTIKTTDFLSNPPDDTYDYIIANPPYIPYRSINSSKRDTYRNTFTTATGQFNLQHLFFEQALDLLADNGRLVILTPHKYLTSPTTDELRTRIRREHPQKLISLPQPVFPNHAVDPVISIIDHSPTNTLADPLTLEELPHDTYTTFANELNFPHDIWSRYQSGLISKQQTIRQPSRTPR